MGEDSGRPTQSLPAVGGVGSLRDVCANHKSTEKTPSEAKKILDAMAKVQAVVSGTQSLEEQ